VAPQIGGIALVPDQACTSVITRRCGLFHLGAWVNTSGPKQPEALGQEGQISRLRPSIWALPAAAPSPTGRIGA